MVHPLFLVHLDCSLPVAEVEDLGILTSGPSCSKSKVLSLFPILLSAFYSFLPLSASCSWQAQAYRLNLLPRCHLGSVQLSVISLYLACLVSSGQKDILYVLGAGTEDGGSYMKEVFGGHCQRKKMAPLTHKYTVLTKGFKVEGRNSVAYLSWCWWCWGVCMLGEMVELRTGRCVWEKGV